MSSTREVAGKTAVALICLAACSSSPEARSDAQSGGSSASSTGGSRGTGGSATATGGSAVATGGAGAAGTGGLTGTGGDSSDTPAALPFAVDQYYSASGFMGDGATAGLIVLDNTCQDPRPAGALGQCYRFSYRQGAAHWGGVYWQYPANNWGATPGKRIAQGATRIRFYAAGAVGGEPVSFIVFGVGDAMATYRDPPVVTLTPTLTTTMTAYEINISGQTYDAVIGGFGWVSPPAGVTLPADAGAPIVVYIDGIEWL